MIGDDVIAQASGFGLEARYFLYDGHGSTRQLADAASNIACRYTYEAYGLVHVATSSSTAESAPTSVLYCGEQYDPMLQMYNLRARFYDPSSGRFNARDTFLGNNFDPQSLHKYAYCHCDPVNRRDWSGRSSLLVTTLTVVGIGAIIGMLASVGAVYAYQGRAATFGEIMTGGALGALLALGCWVVPELAIVLGLYGIIQTGYQGVSILLDPNVSIWRKVAAIALFLASVYGTAKAVEYTRVMRGYVPKSSDDTCLIPESYMNKIGAVDMRSCPNPKGYNEAGFPRNGNWFFLKLVEEHPQWFSELNKVRISSNKAPLVDDVWIASFPEHAPFHGASLVHHHILQGPIAVPVPMRVHQIWYKALHPGVPDVISAPSVIGGVTGSLGGEAFDECEP